MKKLLSPFLVFALCIFNSCTNNASTMNDEVSKTLTHLMMYMLQVKMTTKPVIGKTP
jgi:hypothetical protein